MLRPSHLRARGAAGSSAFGAPFRFAVAAGVLTGAFLLGAGCISTENERTLELAVGTRCTLNSDCTDPNVCVFGTCHAECNSSADCQHDERCVKGEKGGVNVCQLSSEASCATSADCSGTQVCGVDGACRDGCKATADCLTGQVCTQGTCADQEEVDPMTGALPEDPEHVGEGQPCTYNTDCPEDLACIQSSCAYQCNGDKDCSPGQACEAHFCKVKTPIPVECTNASQCGMGFLCVQNACVAGCATDADCTIGSRCFGAKCVAPVFDAAGHPDAVAANDSSILTIYNGHVLRCPNTGCTPTNVENLFDTILLGSGTITFGGSASSERLFADGPATFVVVSDYSLYQEAIYGCRDAACNDYVESSSFGIAQTKTLRESAGGIVVYEVRDDGKGGLAFAACRLTAVAPDCKQSFSIPLNFSGGAYPSSMAVEKGATPAADKVYVGWEDGRIERFDVTDCAGGSCAPVLVTTITDGIGLPVEVTELHVVPGASGAELLVLTGNGNSEGGYTYLIDRCASSACTPTHYYQHSSFVLPQLAVGGGSVYLADDGNVWKSPL